MKLDDIAMLLARESATWIRNERDTNRPHSVQLSKDLLTRLDAYFSCEILDRTRVRIVPAISNPPFYQRLPQTSGIPVIDFSQMTGITFDDTILLRNQALERTQVESLLFHELVHVAQYALLGVDQFAARYVTGWIQADMNYAGIPLEMDAYALQAKFDSGGASFSVEGELRDRASLKGAT